MNKETYIGIIQSILAENPHEKDPIAREDAIYFRLGELCSEECYQPPLLTEAESMECWTQYIQSVRPDVRVIHLGEVISERARFYE